MSTWIAVAQIVVSVILILSLLLQLKGGGLGSVFGSDSTTFRTRRGFEKSVFQLTIFLAIAAIGNLVSLPRNAQAVRNQDYKNTSILINSLRHINDKDYQPPDFIRQNPVYDFFASERN